MPSDTILSSPPSDGISSLSYSPCASSRLLVSSWDGSVRVYDTSANALRGSVHGVAAVLDACWSADGATLYSGGLDRSVRAHDAATLGEGVTLGAHDDAVRCVITAPGQGLLLSGSWDHSVKAWDARSTASSGRPATSWATPDRVYAMSTVGPHTLVVATAGRHILHYDLRSLTQVLSRESSLKHQTRCLRGFLDGSGYASGSIEGRIAVDFLDEAAGAAKYAFKCHRAKPPAGASGAEALERVFPVHALALHPTQGTFASGGGDGHVSIWDWQARKRLHQSAAYATSIAALAFSPEGGHLAIAASYAYESGEAEHPPDAIYVREVAEGEVKPKARV